MWQCSARSAAAAKWCASWPVTGRSDWRLGASMMIEDTYCHRLLTGRLSNIVRDTNADHQLRELPITRAARVGAYIGVPLTTIDARLYVLCCLAHEQRPQLSRRDVLFLRGVADQIVAELEQRRTQHTHDSDPTPAH